MERRDCMKRWLISTNYKRRLVDNEFGRPAFILNAQAFQRFPPTLFLRHLLGIWEFAGFDMKKLRLSKDRLAQFLTSILKPIQKLFYHYLKYSQAQNMNTFREAFSKHFLNRSFSVFCLSLWTYLKRQFISIERYFCVFFLSF